MFRRTFLGSLLVTVVVLAGALLLGGPETFALVAILAVLEVSLSFDNAVVNAKVLGRMSSFWQKIFLTVGVAIAVFGMRLIFPFALVSITAGITPGEVLDLALNHPERYESELVAAHPAIAAFGGVFLLMIFLDFVFEEREIRWLAPLERALEKIGKLDQLSVVITLTALVLAAETLADNPTTVLVSGALGLVTYLLVNGLGEFFGADDDDADDADDAVGADGAGERRDEGEAAAPAVKARNGTGAAVLATGKAAFFLFLYLEVLDASFSFDGVVGAFAVTNKAFVIAAGLGVGAMFVRSLTVFLVNKGTLSEYVFLEHGAHWAIGALAVILLVTIDPQIHVPELVTGMIGVVLVFASFVSSVLRNRREAAADAASTDSAEQLAEV
jgi:hypothetical protein